MRLCVEQVSFGYNKKQTVLQNISFQAESGQLIALLGPNGSGKTTLVKCINRILTPREGHITLDGVRMESFSQAKVARRIGYVPQMTKGDGAGTVLDMVLMGRRPFIKWNIREQDIQIALEILDRIGAVELAHREFCSLSGGQRQKILIARAMAQEPEMFLFDEPICFLDVQNQLSIMEMARDMVQQKNKLAIMVVHDLNLALRYSDRILLLQNGNVVDQGVSTEVLNHKNIEAVYGVTVKMIKEETGNYLIPLETVPKKKTLD